MFSPKKPEDEFAFFARCYRLAGLRVDGLGEEVVFLNVEAILCFVALDGNAGAHDFGQAVNVDGLDAEFLFDVLTHFVGPRLSAEDTDSQGQVFNAD